MNLDGVLCSGFICVHIRSTFQENMVLNLPKKDLRRTPQFFCFILDLLQSLYPHHHRMVGPHKKSPTHPNVSIMFHSFLMNHEPSFTTNHNIPTISPLYTLLYAHKIPAFPRVFSSQSSQNMGLPTTRKASAQALRRPGKFRNGPLRNVESTGYGGFKQQNVGIYRDVIGILCRDWTHFAKTWRFRWFHQRNIGIPPTQTWDFTKKIWGLNQSKVWGIFYDLSNKMRRDYHPFRGWASPLKDLMINWIIMPCVRMEMKKIWNQNRVNDG